MQFLEHPEHHKTDLIIILKDDDIKKFSAFCKKNKLDADEYEIKKAFKERSHVTIFDIDSTYRIDIKGVYSELDKITFSRRKKIKFRDFEMWVNTAEDAILAKLVYGGYQDINDVKSIILRRGKKIDFDYLKKQAKHFGVLELLESLSHLFNSKLYILGLF